MSPVCSPNSPAAASPPDCGQRESGRSERERHERHEQRRVAQRVAEDRDPVRGEADRHRREDEVDRIEWRSQAQSGDPADYEEPEQRDELCRQIKASNAADWDRRALAIERSVAEYGQLGFAASEREWEPDISAVGSALLLGDGKEPYVLNIGGPSAWLTHERLYGDLGPRLADAARRIQEALLSGQSAESS